MKTRRSYRLLLLGLVLFVGLGIFSGCKKRPTSVTPPTSETPTSVTPTSETPTSVTPTSETPTSETPTSETPTSETPTSETPTSETPSTDEHKAASEWSKDATSHWHACVVDGCTEKFNEATHSGGTADCQHKAVCSVCGQEYGNLGDHVPSATWSYDDAQHYHVCTVEGCTEKLDTTAHSYTWAPDPTNPDQHIGTCVCGKTITAAHTPGSVWHSDATHHWHSCTTEGCDAQLDKAAHSGGTATCHAKAVCTACGEEYGSTLPHAVSTDWSNDATHHWHGCTTEGCDYKEDVAAHIYDQKIMNENTVKEPSSCTTQGEYYYSCICGALGDATFTDETIPSHNFIDQSSASHHFKECSKCGLIIDIGEHSFNTHGDIILAPTDTEPGIFGIQCSVCGYVDGYTILSKNETPNLFDLGLFSEGPENKRYAALRNYGGIEHIYEIDGDGFIEQWHIELGSIDFYLKHDSTYGYSSYESENAESRFVITEEQYLGYLRGYTNLFSDVFLGDMRENEINKTNFIAKYGEDLYRYDIFVVDPEIGELVVFVMRAIDDTTPYYEITQIFLDDDGITQLVQLSYSLDFSPLSSALCNRQDSYMEIITATAIDNREVILVSGNTGTEVGYALNEYWLTRPYHVNDSFDIEDFITTIDSTKYRIEGGFISYDDMCDPILFGSEGTVTIPYTDNGEVVITFDVWDNENSYIYFMVNTYGYIEGDQILTDSTIHYEDIAGDLMYCVGNVPVNMQIIGFNTDPNATEPLDDDYVVQNGDVFYPIFKQSIKIAFISSVSGWPVEIRFLIDEEIEVFLDIGNIKQQGENLYMYFDLDLLPLYDYPYTYKSDGHLYTSIECTTEVPSIKVEDETYYLLSLDLENVFYIKYLVGQIYYLNHEMGTINAAKEAVFADVYAELKDEIGYYVKSSLGNAVVIDSLYVDKYLTIPFTEEELKYGSDIHLYPKLIYPSDGVMITIDDSIIPIENNIYSIYELKRYYNTESFEDMYYDLLYNLRDEEAGIIIEGLYLDENFEYELDCWPTEDITVYPKKAATITIAKFDLNYSWDGIKTISLDSLWSDYYELMIYQGYSHLSFASFVKYTLYWDEVESYLTYDRAVEDFYLDPAYKIRFEDDVYTDITLYVKLIPAPTITLDDSNTLDDNNCELFDSDKNTLSWGIQWDKVEWYDNFEWFKIRLIHDELLYYYDVIGYYEIDEIYIDPECTIPLTDYPTTDVTLYITLRETAYITFASDVWTVKASYVDDGVSLYDLVFNWKSSNMTMLYYNLMNNIYVVPDGKTIDYLYYMDGNKEVILTELPNKAMEIHIKEKDEVYITFDDSEYTSDWYGSDPIAVTDLKATVYGSDIEHLIAYLNEYQVFFDNDDYIVIEGFYTDSNFGNRLTEWPTSDVTVYIQAAKS